MRPLDVLLHAAVSVPVVGEGQDELEVVVAGLGDHVVERVEEVLVVYAGSGLELAVVERPGSERRARESERVRLRGRAERWAGIDGSGTGLT